jgi:hypothetical protein
MMAESLVQNNDCNIEFLAESVCALCDRQIYSDIQAHKISDLVVC